MSHPEIIFFFFLIAIIYASVGFGGGSSYIAILALYALPYHEVRIIALICNIIVVAGGTGLFIRYKEVNWKKIIPIICAGAVMAFIGAQMRLSEKIYYVILGISLIAAGILLFFERKRVIDLAERKTSLLRDSLLGSAIGFLSGLVGIGGGIFLSPILNLMHWDTSKKIAATASVFILVNSIFGIAGSLSNVAASIDFKIVLILGLAVFAGGQIGTRIGLFKFNQLMVRKVTGLLVLVAGIEILIKHLNR